MIKKIISSEECNKKYSTQCVRSFMCRRGRITKNQKYALDKLWPIMGIEYQQTPLDFDKLFAQKAPVILEIGFGMGRTLIDMAVQHPEQNFLGIEVYLPGVGSCLSSAQKVGISNLRIICHDAVEVLENMISDSTLSLVQIFFPDPWHKTRHHKRRIIQFPFVTLVGHKLCSGGIFHIATDWKSYAEHILMVMSNSLFFKNLSPTGNYMPQPIRHFLTKFEQRGRTLGHNVWDLIFLKNATLKKEKNI